MGAAADYGHDECGPGCTPEVHAACLGPHPWGDRYDGGSCGPEAQPPEGGCEQCFQIAGLIQGAG